MPTLPVAYEAPARQSYDSRVCATLRALGSETPDADIEATGGLERWKKAGLSPKDAAAHIYATARHRHPPTSVLATESRGDWLLELIGKKVDPSTGLAFVPDVVRAMTTKPHELTLKRAHELLYVYAMEGEIELRPEGGIGRLSKEDMRLTLQGPHDTRLAWIRVVDSAKAKRDGGDSVRSQAPGGDSSGGAHLKSKSPTVEPSTQTRSVDEELVRLAKEIGPIRSDKELYRLLAPSMRAEPQEVFRVVCMDVHGDLVAYTEVARGQVARVTVDVEDVLQAVLAVRPRPTAFAICHNHPSGKVRPSEADKSLTERVRAAAKVAMPGTVLVDHLIVGGGETTEYYSFGDKKVKR